MEGVGIDGVERLHGFAPLLASADLFAVVGLPWQAAFTAADQQFWRSAMVTALAFVAAALLALISGEAWIRRPVAGAAAGGRPHGARRSRGPRPARALEQPRAPPPRRELQRHGELAAGPPGRAAGERGAAARGRRHRRRRHHHDQPPRPDRGGQSRRRAPVRLSPRRADRRQRRAADAVARSRAPRPVPGALPARPARRASSASAARSPASARTARRCRCRCRSASSRSMAGASSPASCATSPSASGRRSTRRC